MRTSIFSDLGPRLLDSRACSNSKATMTVHNITDYGITTASNMVMVFDEIFGKETWDQGYLLDVRV